METITIKSVTTTETQREVKLPYYCKTTEYNVICVKSEDKAIRACIYPVIGGALIDLENPKFLSIDKATEISENEFFKVYNQALEIIKGGLL